MIITNCKQVTENCSIVECEIYLNIISLFFKKQTKKTHFTKARKKGYTALDRILQDKEIFNTTFLCFLLFNGDIETLNLIIWLCLSSSDFISSD